MPEPALAAHPPADHLSRRLLRRTSISSGPVGALLEQLCVDSIYRQHDDFDEGLNEQRWETEGFEFDPEADLGAIVGGESGLPSYLISRARRWQAGRRCVVLGRLTAFHLAKFEFGFSSEAEETVLVKDSDNLNGNEAVRDFAVACHDLRDDGEVALVGHGNGVTGSTTLTSPVPATSIAAGTEFSLMVGLNEQEEVRWWINGIYAGVNRTGPASLAPLGIWVHLNGAPVSIDYLYGYQERVPLL